MALLLGTVAQLLVPQMVQNILDAVTQGLTAQQIASAPVVEPATALAQAGMTEVELQQTLANLLDRFTGLLR